MKLQVDTVDETGDKVAIATILTKAQKVYL